MALALWLGWSLDPIVLVLPTIGFNVTINTFKRASSVQASGLVLKQIVLVVGLYLLMVSIDFALVDYKYLGD